MEGVAVRQCPSLPSQRHRERVGWGGFVEFLWERSLLIQQHGKKKQKKKHHKSVFASFFDEQQV
jgi:hypothetical protein